MPGYDAIVIGLRCAGAPLATLLTRKGYRVLGIDRANYPNDTISTHFLWPRATAMLSAWGCSIGWREQVVPRSGR